MMCKDCFPLISASRIYCCHHATFHHVINCDDARDDDGFTKEAELALLTVNNAAAAAAMLAFTEGKLAKLPV